MSLVIKTYINLTLFIAMVWIQIQKCLDNLLILLFNYSPDYFWKLFKYDNWLKLSIVSEPNILNEYKLKWLFYYSLYTINQEYFINLNKVNKLINIQNLKINITYINNNTFNMLIIDFNTKKYQYYKSNDISNEWKPILFNRIKL
jgi:hypothetical protein